MAEVVEKRCPHPQETTIPGTSNNRLKQERLPRLIQFFIASLLRVSCFQLCYVDPGIASSEEMEQLKIIDSILIRF